jgi:hypothetical protein
MLKVSKALGVGVSTVQRVKTGMAAAVSEYPRKSILAQYPVSHPDHHVRARDTA